MDEAAALLVLGLGNVLLGDDGLGAAAVHRLSRDFVAPPAARVLDGGTLGLALLPHLEDARAAILVDAVRGDAPPGTLVRLAGDAVAPAVLERLSPHQVGVADLLQGARWRGRCPPALVLIGLVPAAIDLGLGRSPAVDAALGRLVAQIVAEARAFGHHFRPRRDDERALDGSARDVARILGL
ncbi:MAG TPA: hydrogenase maturation protease [Candidatus Binatia bacterium]|nr:hydrogenase maturation protease [Candidatus Binatia bacterium]